MGSYEALFGRSDDDRAALIEKRERINKIARDNWHNPAWRAEMAAVLTQTIYKGFEHENLLNLMTVVENAPIDARVTIREARGLRAFWMARGGYIEMSNMRADVIEVPRHQIGFHVGEFSEKLETNFAETQATLTDMAIMRMDAEINLWFLRLMQASIPSGSPYYISSSGLSLTSLNLALSQVRTEARDPNGVVIVGLPSMTDQILNQLTSNSTNTGFIPTTNEEILARGVLGTYRGARIISLTNYKDDNEIPFFPANEMYVIARDASRFVFWGGFRTKEYEEDDNWYWHLIGKREAGAVVHRPRRIRRIVDTSQPAYVQSLGD